MLRHWFLNPQDDRLRTGWRLLIHLAIFGAFELCLALPLAMGIWLGKWDLTLSLVVGQTAAMFSTTLSVILARRFLDKRTFSSLGLAWDVKAGQDLALGFLIAALMMTLVFGIEFIAGWARPEDISWHSKSLGLVLLEMLGWLGLFLSIGWSEELLSRGYQLVNLKESLGNWRAALITSLFFAALHAFNPGAHLNSFLGLTLSGMLFAFCAFRSGRLWLPIGLHVGWNFFEGSVFGFPVSGLEVPGLVKQAQNGPEVFTGGNFGPEAGLVLIPALVLGAALIYLATRRRQNEIR